MPIDPLTAMAGAGIVTTGINNLFAQKNAQDSYHREVQLMKMQNNMNNANAKNAHINDVEGMRLAGLNPALGQGGSPAAPTVGLGSADMAQTFPFNASDALALAQIENINADTDLKKTKVPNTQADTSLKVAEKLFKQAGTKKVNEETENIKNINTQYKEQNGALSSYGQIMAQKWQNASWYSGLAPDTKNTIDAMAFGEIPLTVGSMAALERTINAQKNLSDADRTVVKNAFDNAVTDAMFGDQAVMNAIAQEPLDKRKMLYKHMDEIEASIKKINAEIPNIVQELQNLQSKKKNIDMDTAFNEAKLKAFKAGDLDYLKSQGEYGKWVEKYAEDRLADVVRMAPAIAGGRAIGSSMKKSTELQPIKREQWRYNKNGQMTSHTTSGVQNFW